MIYGKYAEQQELVTTVPPGEVAKQTENPKASAVTSHKTLPQTNDFVKSYSLLGGVLLISAIMGLKSEVAKQTENPKASAVTSHKTLPQTNDFVKSYSLLGGVLLISAIMGLKKTQKYRGKK